MPRACHYRLIADTVLLDEEEALLREQGAMTLSEVDSYWHSRYPNAQQHARDVIVAELYRRLTTAPAPTDLLKMMEGH